MGLLSSTRRSTVNQDNRSIVDMTNAEIDNSVTNDYDYSNETQVEGLGNFNSGTISVIDGGAFELVDSASGRMANVVNQAGILNADVIRDASYIVDNANTRSLALAINSQDNALAQVMAGNDLAYGLSSLTNQSAENIVDDTNDALATGFQSFMQFADSFSRSDGNALAMTNMKTIALIVGGVVVSVGLFTLINRGK